MTIHPTRRLRPVRALMNAALFLILLSSIATMLRSDQPTDEA